MRFCKNPALLQSRGRFSESAECARPAFQWLPQLKSRQGSSCGGLKAKNRDGLGYGSNDVQKGLEKKEVETSSFNHLSIIFQFEPTDLTDDRRPTISVTLSAISAIDEPGPNTAATPCANNRFASSRGMIPPTKSGI